MSMTIASAGSVVVRQDVPFISTPDGDLGCDLYLPAGPGPHPALVLVHGGAWHKGSKAAYAEWGPLLAEHGYIAMSVNYRLARAERPTWPAALDDVRAALGWLTDHAAELKADADRIGLIGASAGGHLVCLLALEQPDRVQAVIPVYGVLDPVDWWRYTQTARDDDPVTRFIGATPQHAAEAYAAASPLARVEAMFARGESLNVPFLVIWGDADAIVPPRQSETFVAALHLVHAPVESVVVPGAGHFWFNLSEARQGGGIHDEPNPRVVPRVLEFLGKRLGARV
jgi:acetyl esterase/lipase